MTMDRLSTRISATNRGAEGGKRLAILDGGFATHLEDAYGQDLSGSLWSASMLLDDGSNPGTAEEVAAKKGKSTGGGMSGRELIRATHRDFIEAGADIILTSTYQASRLAFAQAGYSDALADELLVESVKLADQARVEGQKSGKPSLVGLSLGPFGAALSNGSEYTGDYFIPTEKSPKSGPSPSSADLETFHRQRLETIFDSEQGTAVDVVAFETLPRLDEASAARRATAKVRAKMGQGVVTYASFVFPDGKTLPWPAAEEPLGNEATEKHFMDLLEATVGEQQGQEGAPLDGVGINCTKPYYIRTLVQRLTQALVKLQGQGMVAKKPYLFLYPDGGLIWDGQQRVWRAATNGPSDSDGNVANRGAWASQLMDVAQEVLASSDGNNTGWEVVILGGCCKATASDIAELKKLTT